MMKIRIMEQQVLDKIKDNMKEYIEKYFIEDSNDWLWNVCDCDPFEDFKEINDFSLADANQQATIIDFYNCKILYSNLNFLNESQAADERLWAGLSNDIFYSYLRKRFNMSEVTYHKAKNPIGDVLTRFFYKNSGRSGYFRNALAKCWWVGHHTYDSINKFKLLDTLGPNDMSTKVTDIFHNYTFSSCNNVLSGIIEGIGYFNANGIKYNMQKDVRPCLQYINAIGGSLVLDVFTTNEIRDIFIKQLQLKLDGKTNDLVYDNYVDDNIEDTVAIDDNLVMMGDLVHVIELDTEKVKKYQMKYKSETDLTLYPFVEMLIGKREGDIVEFENKKYKIVLIEKNSPSRT